MVKRIAMVLIVLASLTACGADDPLAITCGDYLQKDAETQLSLATTWGAPDRDHIGPAEKLVGPAYKSQLLEYCPAHTDAELKDLSLQVTGP